MISNVVNYIRKIAKLLLLLICSKFFRYLSIMLFVYSMILIKNIYIDCQDMMLSDHICNLVYACNVVQIKKIIPLYHDALNIPGGNKSPLMIAIEMKCDEMDKYAKYHEPVEKNQIFKYNQIIDVLKENGEIY